jgi:exopolysaccharide biosynthesis polyprenyl glycosylphosphotransferase
MAQSRQLHDLPGIDPGTSAASTRVSSARAAYRRLYRWVALSDVIAIEIALLSAYWIRFGFGVPTQDFSLLLAGAPAVALAVFSAAHLYQAFRFPPAEEFRRIILSVSASIGVMMMLSFWLKADFSRAFVGASWVLALLFTLIARRLWHARFGHLRATGELAFPTIVVGTNDEAERLVSMMRRPLFGFRPIGVVTTGSDAGATLGLPVLGAVANLRDLIVASGAECVFVAATAARPEDMKAVARAVRLAGVEVRITATLPEVLASRLTVQPLGGLTALSLRPVRLSGGQVVAKFTFDILVSAFLLFVLSPLFLVIAVAIKLTSPGPILFRQRRVGLRGRPFTILKFRTMRVGTDRDVETLRAQHGVGDLMFKMKDDPRVTRVGRRLRRFSLDELPQLLNVIKGDMSIVGPRPPLPEEVAKYEDWHFDRLEVPPGITGLWQISGRADLSFDECVQLDVFYIENWSLVYEFFILGKTIPVLLSRRGAY